MTPLQKQTRQLLTDIFEGAYDPDIWNFGKAEFAHRVKMSTSAIYKLRKGQTKEPRHTTVLKLCQAVGIPVSIATKQLQMAAKNNLTSKSNDGKPVKRKRKTNLRLVG